MFVTAMGISRFERKGFAVDVLQAAGIAAEAGFLDRGLCLSIDPRVSLAGFQPCQWITCLRYFEGCWHRIKGRADGEKSRGIADALTFMMNN